MTKTRLWLVLENGGDGHRGPLDAFVLSGELALHADGTVSGALVLEGGGAREGFAATGQHAVLVPDVLHVKA